MYFDKKLVGIVKPFGFIYVLWQYRLKPIIKIKELIVLAYYALAKGNRMVIAYTKNHPRMNIVAENAPRGVVFIKLTQKYTDNIIFRYLISRIDAIYQDGPHPISIKTDHPRVLEYEHRYFKQEEVDDPRVRKIFVMSRYAKPNLIDPDHKIEVLYPAFPVIKRKINLLKDPNKVTIFLSGSEATRKGADILFRAFENVERTLSDKYRLFLVMASNYKKHSNFFPVTEKCLERTRRAYHKSKSKNNVVFSPIYPPRLVSYFYQKADIYVIPTRYDTPGMSILEAMCAGLPVITTNITSIPELVRHGNNGFLIDVKDYDLRSEDYYEYAVKELEKYLTRLIENVSLRRQMGENSIQRMEKYLHFGYKMNRLNEIFGEIEAENVK